MQHLNLDAYHESVKQFVLDLSHSPTPSVLDLAGRSLVCVLPMADEKNNAVNSSDWNEVKNARRCMLIDKKIDGSILPSERVELESLQSEMLAHRRRVAPLPLEEARALHQQLLDLALRKSQSGS